jgi:hypothetical protein
VHRTHTKTKNETNLVNDMQMFSPKSDRRHRNSAGDPHKSISNVCGDPVLPHEAVEHDLTAPRNTNPAVGRYLRVVPDPPRVLPTLIAGDDEDPEVDPWEVLEMSLPQETLIMMQRQGISVQDVLDGKVPGLDPDEIVAKAIEETGSYTGPWTPFAF